LTTVAAAMSTILCLLCSVGFLALFMATFELIVDVECP